MRIRTLVTMSLLLGVACLSELAAAARGAEGPSRQKAVVMFQDAVSVGGTFLMGRVLIVHDEDRMDRGEPCTQFFRIADGKPLEEIVAVHCKRVNRPVAEQLTLSMKSPDINYRVLTAYQFRGSDHAHELLPAGHAGH